MSNTAVPASLPPDVRVFEMAAAAVPARALWAAAEAGVADHVDDDPRGVDELAAARAALRLTRVIPTMSPVSIVEAE